MGPDELALLQVLLSSGYTEEQAMQILNSGAFAPGVAPPAVQYAVANPGMTYDLNRAPLWATPTPQLEQAEYPSSIASGGISTGVGSPMYSNPDPMRRRFSPNPWLSGGTSGEVDFGGNALYLQSSRMSSPPLFAAADRDDAPLRESPGAMGMPMGTSYPSYGVNPNAYAEKERSVGNTRLADVIQALMSMGRKAAAQSRPQPASRPGRSAQAPGQMKQAAGVQSARTPAATQRNAPRPVVPAAPSRAKPAPAKSTSRQSEPRQFSSAPVRNKTTTRTRSGR